MHVKEIMSSQPSTARADHTLRQAARLMADERVGSLPVCEGRRLIGIVTDRDMVVRGMAHGLGVDATVADVMTKDPLTVSAGDDVDLVRERMSVAQVRRLPVIDATGDLVGMVALADIARTARPDQTGATLEDISDPVLGEGWL